MVEITTERIELFGPETFVARDPHRRALHGRGIQFAANHAPFFRARDQAGGLQNGQVLHEARQRHGVRLRQLADRETAAIRLRQLRQDAAARCIGQRRKDEVELGLFIVNHWV